MRSRIRSSIMTAYAWIATGVQWLPLDRLVALTLSADPALAGLGSPRSTCGIVAGYTRRPLGPARRIWEEFMSQTRAAPLGHHQHGDIGVKKVIPRHPRSPHSECRHRLARPQARPAGRREAGTPRPTEPMTSCWPTPMSKRSTTAAHHLHVPLTCRRPRPARCAVAKADRHHHRRGRAAARLPEDRIVMEASWCGSIAWLRAREIARRRRDR